MKLIRKYFLNMLWVIYRQKKFNLGEFWCVVIFGFSCLSWKVTGWIHGHLKIGGEKYIQTKRKLNETVWLYDATVYYILAGNRLSQIKTGSRYKPSEIVQLPSLLTIRGRLERKCRRIESVIRRLNIGQNEFWMIWGNFFVVMW